MTPFEELLENLYEEAVERCLSVDVEEAKTGAGLQKQDLELKVKLHHCAKQTGERVRNSWTPKS